MTSIHQSVIAAFEAAYPELYYHIAKGKICAGEPLYGAIITTIGTTEIGHGESNVSADDALRIAVEDAGLSLPTILTDREARSGWRDIASAPQTDDILAFDGYERKIVRWGSLYLRRVVNGKEVDLYGWTVPGETGRQFRATHWMPLPASPSPSREETEGEKETADATEWRYEIKYGPDGEANYAWVYRGRDMVATMRTHHAMAICGKMNSPALLLEAEMALESIAGNGDGTGRNPQLMVNAALAVLSKIRGGE